MFIDFRVNWNASPILIVYETIGYELIWSFILCLVVMYGPRVCEEDRAFREEIAVVCIVLS